MRISQPDRSTPQRVAYDKAYRAAHRVERAEISRLYRLAHPEKRREFNQRHRGQIAEYNRKRYESDKEARRIRNREYAKSHPQVRAHMKQQYRASLFGNGGSHTMDEWRKRIREFSGCCAYCGRDDVGLTRDHMIPLSRGGSNDIENVIPACRSCNSRKKSKTYDEFISHPIDNALCL